MSGVEAVFGIAASGAGLLSLGIQLMESAAMLKKIYHAARDAPRIIATLQFSLETMALALRQLEQRRQQRTASDTLLARCIVECELHTAEIQELINKMDERLSKDFKLGGRLYAVFKQRDVKELLDGLEKAKSSLELAYMMYLGEEQRRRDQVHTDMLALHGTLIDGLHAQVSAGNASLAQQLMLLGQSSVSSPQHRSAIIPSAQANTTSTANRVRRKNNKPCFRAALRFPSWLTTRIFHFAVIQAQGGWSIHLRTFNHVPDGSLIFRYCAGGDVKGMKSLFKSGMATPLDAVSRDGGWWTLIEAAADWGHLEVCRYLLNQTTWPDHAERLASSLTSYAYWASTPSTEMYRLFLEEPGFDIDIGNNLWLDCDTEVEFLEIVLQNQFPELESRSFEARVELAGLFTRLDGAAFLRCVGLQAQDPRLASLRDRNGETVLHRILPSSSWLDIGLCVLQNGADPSSVAFSRETGYDPEWQVTPLMNFLGIFPWRSPREPERMLDLIHTWAEMILLAGLDLCEYGARESKIWRDLGVQNSCRHPGDWWEWKVVQLVYGPTPADWSLIVSRDWTFDVYRLQPPPGAYSDDPRLPTKIIWRPTNEEENEGPWILVEGVRRVGKEGDIRDMIPKLSAREADSRHLSELLGGSQDDSSAVMLMQYRASRVADGTRMRSRSQPPGPNPKAVPFFGAWHIWLDYHFCPLDSRFKLGFDVGERSCFGGACSTSPTSSQQTGSWGDFSFLAEISRCQDYAPTFHDTHRSGGSSLRHDFTREFPQGCKNVDLSRLNVPEPLRPFHPRRKFEDQYEDNDEDSSGDESFDESE
ncbi:hypothetical protein AYL99_02571 [Fonsecaea erecta]|uniref:Fungal N-terminal domain-containing protein n=1 Tax=Fonsecaea erecta TaxID=1367422 RepID=A0A178ZU98_9EURO|nr:hypothetical protein AYL99_02571 [Fonsecaea erecta]OAP63344.1 hypothetical protein AYL99_02571 [Fonsecaea erecta]